MRKLHDLKILLGNDTQLSMMESMKIKGGAGSVDSGSDAERRDRPTNQGG